MKRIAVLGGGVSGVIAAKHLADKKIAKVDLIEKSRQLGGLHRSIQLDGLVFDIGAFEFSAAHELLRSFPILHDSFVPVRTVSLSVTHGGTVCRYPVTVQSYLRDNGPASLLRAIPDVLVSRVRYRKRDTVPTFAKYYMGEQIYRLSGLQKYIERLYGIKDEEVGLEFALQRMGKIRPISMAWRHLGLSTPSTSLMRPPEGFEETYRKVAACLTGQGVDVRLDCSVRSVAPGTQGGYEIDFGDRKEQYDRVVSTIPIPTMLRMLGETPKASFQHVALLSLFYRGNFRHRASFLYNFTMRGFWKRITLFSSFYGPHDGGDYFTVEITTQDISPHRLEMLRADFESHAAELRLIEPASSLSYLGSTVTERAYPLFRAGKGKELQGERDRLTAAGIDFVGRQGSFAYLSSHVAAQQAADLAATIGRSID